jgi:pimeloyl-ACP methyl ester carboxylesterase
MTRFVERDGVKLAYDTAGGGQPPIVFVHGWSCDRSYFAPQIEHFSAHHATASLDLRGHGMSGVPEPGPGVYEVDAFADDVLAVAVAAAAGFERPVVIGHSLGGLTALACAARPGAVSAAVMVDPAPIVNPAIKAFIGKAADAIETDDDGSWRESFVSGMFLPTDTARRDEIIRGMTELPPPRRVRHDHRRPDGGIRPLQSARGARPGEPDDRTVPRGERVVVDDVVATTAIRLRPAAAARSAALSRRRRRSR